MAIDVNIPSQVKNYANLAAFPATGTLKTIFIAEDTNKTYRWTGSAYVEISAAGASGITIGTTAITSGTVGRVLFEGTGNVVQESANLFWDNTNLRFQVGTSSTTPFGSPLIFMGKDQNAETNFQISNSTNGTGATVGFRVFGANNRSTFLGEFSQGHTGVTEFATNYVIEPNAPNIKHGLIISIPETTTGSDFMIYTGGRTSGNRKLTLFGSTGNLAINNTTDAGFKLDVNGTARVEQTLRVNGTGTDIAIQFRSGRIDNNGTFMRIKSPTNNQDMVNLTANFLGINATAVIPSAIMAITSTDRGFLPPRMTTTEKNAIASPATGLMVYDTTLNLISVYNGTIWISL